jgi:hypothetical protein
MLHFKDNALDRASLDSLLLKRRGGSARNPTSESDVNRAQRVIQQLKMKESVIDQKVN